MHCRNQLIAMLWIGLVLGRAEASPPPIERDPPRKEPVYQGIPYYCLLVIGREAKRHWLVLDGETLYFDRDGNGDLTDKGDRIPPNSGASGIRTAGEKKASPQALQSVHRTLPPGLIPLGAIRGAAGQVLLSNLIFQRRSAKDPKDMSFAICTDDPKVVPKPPSPFGFGGSIGIGNRPFPLRSEEEPGWSFVRVAEGVLARRPQDAPIIWFDGPLTLSLALRSKTFLVRGDMPAYLSVMVGTFASENGSRILTLEEIPAGLHPVADVEFLARSDAKPIRARFVLDQRC